jgi:hypothetical protein
MLSLLWPFHLFAQCSIILLARLALVNKVYRRRKPHGERFLRFTTRTGSECRNPVLFQCPLSGQIVDRDAASLSFNALSFSTEWRKFQLKTFVTGMKREAGGQGEFSVGRIFGAATPPGRGRIFGAVTPPGALVHVKKYM